MDNGEVTEVATTTTQTVLEQDVQVEQPVDVPAKELSLTEMSPTELVEKFSEEYGADPELAKAIIKCESGWNREIKTQIPNVVSSASGYFQFLDSTWLNTMIRMGLPQDTDKHDPIISIQAGVWLLSEDGTRHWLESEPCWSNLI